MPQEDKKEILEAIAGLSTKIDGLSQDVGGLKNELGDLKKDVGGLQQELGGLKNDVGVLQQDVSGLKSDVGSLKSDMGSLKSDVNSVKQLIEDVAVSTANGFHEAQEERIEMETRLSSKIDNLQNRLDVHSGLDRRVDSLEIDMVKVKKVVGVA